MPVHLTQLNIYHILGYQIEQFIFQQVLTWCARALSDPLVCAYSLLWYTHTLSFGVHVLSPLVCMYSLLWYTHTLSLVGTYSLRWCACTFSFGNHVLFPLTICPLL